MVNLALSNQIIKMHKEIEDQPKVPLRNLNKEGYFELLFNILPKNIEESKTEGLSEVYAKIKTDQYNKQLLIYLNLFLNIIAQRPYPFISNEKYEEFKAKVREHAFLKPLCAASKNNNEEITLI